MPPNVEWLSVTQYVDQQNAALREYILGLLNSAIASATAGGPFWPLAAIGSLAPNIAPNPATADPGNLLLSVAGSASVGSGAAMALAGSVPAFSAGDFTPSVEFDDNLGGGGLSAGQAIAGFGNSLYVGVVTLGNHQEILCFAEQLRSVDAGGLNPGDVVVWSPATPGTTTGRSIAKAGAVAGLTTIAGVSVRAVPAPVVGGTVPALVARRGICQVNAEAGIATGNLVETSGATAGRCVAGAPGSGALLGRATCPTAFFGTANKVFVDLVLA